jgi:signal peptidase I
MATERPSSQAKRPAPESPAPESFRKSTAREYFESIVIAVVLALFIRTFVVQAFKIPTGSMENNLLIGDHLLVNKFVFAPGVSSVARRLLPIGTIKRGDIVVFKYPEEPERDFIKRVIGLPGEKLELKDKKVYIDDRPIDEPYVHFLTPPSGTFGLSEQTTQDVRERYGPVTVPEGHYFAMGDNRDNSQDSRYWGFLPHDYVKGRALVIYWSYDAGPEEYVETDAGTALRNVLSMVTHFFSRTRWDRMFRPIH